MPGWRRLFRPHWRGVWHRRPKRWEKARKSFVPRLTQALSRCSDVDLRPDGGMVRGCVDRLLHFLVLIPLLRLNARPHASAEDSAPLNLCHQFRREQHIVDLVLRAAVPERAGKTTILETAMRADILEPGLIHERLERITIRRVV